MPRFPLLLALPLLASAPPSFAQPAPGQNSAQAHAPANGIMAPAFNVSDMARARHFYVDGLGMQVNLVMGQPHYRETILGFDADASHPSLILLIDETAAQHPPIVQSNGFAKLVIRIADLDACTKRLVAAGFTPTPIREIMPGTRIMFVTDPDGYKLELVERRTKQ